MRLRLVSSLFLSTSSSNSNYNAALHIFGPPTMFPSDLHLPSEPPNAVIESNEEILRRLGHDLTGIDELSAIDVYRLFLHADSDHPTWGYCLEAARNEITNEIQILFHSDEEEDDERFLDWIPLSSFYTRKQALACYVSYVGSTEEVMWLILELFRDVFECALKTNWSFEKRIEFYHSFPFEELTTKGAVMAFRANLFSCPVFDNFEWTQECE